MRYSMMSKGLSAFLCITLLSFLADAFVPRQTASASASIQIFASPQGGGSGSTPEDPLTLLEARDAARLLIANMSSDIEIKLRGGTYSLSDTFELSHADSGKNGYIVSYSAYENEVPVISGGTKVDGWQLYNTELNIYRAPVNSDLNTRQLYVNGQRAVRAKGGELPGSIKTAIGHTTTDLSMQNWRNIDQIEFVYRSNWIESRCTLDSIDGNSITMKSTCWTHLNAGQGNPVWIENAYELLDDSGEWYLDPANNYIYYIPKPGEDLETADVVVPVLETLVSGVGTLDNPIENIIFEGLTFSYATWLKPSGPYGFREIQGNFYTPDQWDGQRPTGSNDVKIDAAVTLSAAKSVQFKRNKFTHLGAAALNIDKGSQNNLIEGNIFRDISGNGLMIGGVEDEDHHPSDVRRVVKNNDIINNVVTDIGTEFHGAVGIWAGYVENTTIANNTLFDLPYSGISIGWGWGSVDRDLNNPSTSKDNKVLNNHVHHFMQEMNDGGGIYSLGAQRDMLIKGNVVHHQRNDFGAYYLDDGSRYVTMEDNIAFSNKRNLLAKGSDHTIKNNYWDSASNNMYQFSNSILQNNQVIPPGAYPLSIVNQAGITPQYLELLQLEHSGNLAANKNAYVMNSLGEVVGEFTDGGAGLAVDSNLTTYLLPAALSDSWSLMVDIGYIMSIDAIVVTFPEGKAPATYKVETTGDGSQWESVAMNASGSSGRNIIPLDGKEIRNIKVTSLTGEMAVAEIEAYYSGEAVPLYPGFMLTIADQQNVYDSSSLHVTADEETITGISEGTAILTERGGAGRQFKVAVSNFTDVSLIAESTNIAAGRSVQVFLAGRSDDGVVVPFSIAGISFMSNDLEKLIVDATGKVTGVSAGNAGIEAVSNQSGSPIERQLVFNIYTELLNQVDGSLSKKYLHPGESADLTYKAWFTSGSEVDPSSVDSVTYASADGLVATVDDHGEVVAIGEGQTAITLTIEVDGQQKSVEVPVSVFPSGWHYANVNEASGQAVYENGNWNVSARGSDIYGAADQFGFVYREVNMDDYPLGFSITTSVSSIEEISGTTMTGLMFRQSLAPGSPNVNYRVYASGGALYKSVPFTYRSQLDQATDYFMTPDVTLPAKIRLTYRDNKVLAHYWEEESTEWKPAGSIPIDLGEELLVGVAHTSHDPDRYSTTEFSDIDAGVAKDLPLIVQALSDVVPVGGTLSLTTTGQTPEEELLFSSSDTSIAVVDENGVVTGVKKGKVTITVQTLVAGTEPGESREAVFDLIVYVSPEDLITTNIALHKQAAAFYSDLRQPTGTHHPVMQGVDGNLNTEVAASGTYDWAYRVDLGRSEFVTGLGVTFTPQFYATEFEFLTSMDGVSWELTESFTGTEGGIKYTTNLVSGKMIRYAAIRAIKPNSDSQPGELMSIAEFEVYANSLATETLSLNKASLLLGTGESAVLAATVIPSTMNVTWHTSDQSVASVDNGNVIAHNPGSAIITAMTNSGLIAQSIVTVREMSNIAIGKMSRATQPDMQTDVATWHPLVNGNDGDVSTEVAANGSYKWAYLIDLSAEQEIAGIGVIFRPSFYATDFELLTSMDGVNWETEEVFSAALGDVKYKTHFDAGKTARYAAVRAIKPDGSGQPGELMSIAEFEVYQALPFAVVDSTSPEVTLTATAELYINHPFQVNVQFNEDVIGFNPSKTEVDNGTLSEFKALDARNYLIMISPASDGEVRVSVPAGAAVDAAGNGNTASVPFARVYDGTAPTISLSTSASESINAPFQVTATFNEEVTGFDITELEVTNGTASDFQSVSGTIYTFIITPITDGLVTVGVDEGAATDAAGNGNSAALLLNRTYQSNTPSTSEPNPTDPNNSVSQEEESDNERESIGIILNGLQVHVDARKQEIRDGHTMVRLRLTSDQILGLFGTSKKAIIETSGIGDVIVFELSADDLREANEIYPNSSLRVVVDGNGVVLPLQAVTLVPKEAIVTVAIGQVQTEESDSIGDVINNAGAKAVMEFPVMYKIEVDVKNEKNLQDMYREQTIVLPKSVDPNEVTTLWFDENDQPHFVPSTLSEDGRTVTMQARNNGIYMIVQSKRTFQDIAQHWARTEIEVMANKWIIQGRQTGIFAPEDKVTRAEFAALLIRALGLAEKALEQRFLDVSATDWNAGVINAASEAGLITGYEDGRFRPEEFVSREQMAVMLSRALSFAKLQEYETVLTGHTAFLDEQQIADWAKEAVSLLVGLGILRGTSESEFAPQTEVTRAQGAVVIKRLLQNLDFIND
ncbi:S-layer homology domain-containing protein [Paenibacillus nasutitermitis]|uniref:SLH domain-containing protein n=1 Tax=Paenibacillus nasutitermitis TaxID=1652958 RepID=A0A916ZLN4_9BACL|nr:S-layer homology domain-containing protein [Paenibacillus nasutitermitis]GGE02521.1 hypothetical protein GCM10010911_71940 [Paenibacillus nasutitermitis]